MIRRRVVVRGRVQGVWFRGACQQEARQRGVAGWVSNRPDGSVEAVFEGPARDVADLVAWCRHGPPRAVVTALAVESEEPEGLRSFKVT